MRPWRRSDGGQRGQADYEDTAPQDTSVRQQHLSTIKNLTSTKHTATTHSHTHALHDHTCRNSPIDRMAFKGLTFKKGLCFLVINLKYGAICGAEEIGRRTEL